MQDRTFADLFELVEALCGVKFSSLEKPRIKAHINRRARLAHRASNYWPRFLHVGEERAVIDGPGETAVIPFTQVGKPAVDTFLRIYREKPYGNRPVLEYEFIVSANADGVGNAGAQLIIGSENPGNVFLTYKEQLLKRYGDGVGEETSVPDEWFQHLAHGAYADYLRSEGQQQKAMLADQEAELLLTDELVKVSEMHITGLVGNRILTHNNMTYRY